jgi:hypothetical protein
MPDFVITAPDGKKYKVAGANHAGAVAALKKQLGLPIGPTKEAAGLAKPFGEGTVFERPNALAQGGDEGDHIREIQNTGLDQATGALGNYVDPIMLGGADELLAAIENLPKLAPGGQSFGPGFERDLARLEQKRRDYEAVNSDQAAAATGAGIVMNPLNVLGAELMWLPRTVVGRAATGGATGAVAGGVSGGLGTEGDAAERALGAGIGAAGGAVLGGVAQPGAELLGLAARKGSEAGRAFYNTLQNQAAAKADPAGQANKLILRALMDDDFHLPILPDRVQGALPGQGMINLGGENLTALGRQATVAPGRGRTIAGDFFEEQASGAPDRAADALRGLSERGYYGTVETLDATRRAAADPLYTAAYATPAVEQWTPRIAELMRRPSMRGAFERARKIAAEEGRDPMELGLEFNEAGDPVFLAGANSNGQIPSAHTMDYVKRGLDDVINALPRNPATGRPIMDEGTRAIDATRRELVGILRQNPAYSAALDSWAGPSHAIEVTNLGREIFKKTGDPADSIRRFQALSPADQEYARIGFMRDAINSAGNVTDGGSVYNRLFGTSNKRALAEVMFPDRASFDRFAAQMQAEKSMLATNRTVQGGSPTARIDADKAAMSDAENSIGLIESLSSGSIMRMIATALQRAKNLQQGVSPQVAEELAKRLFTGDRAAMQDAITQLTSIQAPAPVAALPGAWLRRTPLAALLGQSSGQGGQTIATPRQ